MVTRGRRRVRIVRVATLLALGTGLFAAVAPPSSADVTSVTGSAFGASGSVSLFGGPPNVFPAQPVVTLPATGGNESNSAPSATFQAGPAVLLESGPLTVNTQGTTGPSGSVTSTATVAGVADGPGPFLYEEVESTCTASESGVSGSTTITGGVVETATDPTSGNATATENVPANPPANLELSGTLNHIGDSFRIVFNEQIPNADGSLTVNGAHMFLLGPTAVGELIFAQSVCGVTATATTTTVPTGATTTVPTGATTTVPTGATTTVPTGATTTTVVQATTTTTAGGATTTSSTMVPAGATTVPPPSRSLLARTGSTFQSLFVLAFLTLVLGALALIGLGSRLASAGPGSGSGPWSALVRHVVERRRRRRPWNRRPWV